MILRNWRTSVFRRLGVFAIFALVSTSVAASDFHFDRETFAFANQTVFEYREGHAYAREKTNEHKKAYNRRCFVLCRAAMQFHKFARFDARGAPLDDKSLAARIRDVTPRTAWAASLPENQRVVFPGYADLREMSKARQGILQENIGLGWPTYLRPGNGRMFFQHDPRYQEETYANLNATLARGQLFVGYLATYPRLYINHSILVYKRKPVSPSSGIERYIAYDPNHPEAPRELPGPPAPGLLPIKKIGISLVASFASFKFTANRCSKNDSLNGEHHARQPITTYADSADTCATA